jgi:hypothetical protein
MTLTSASHAANAKSRASDRFVRILAVGLGGILLLTCLACGAWWLARSRSERPRAHWKSEALARLAKLSITNNTVRRELDELRLPKTEDTELAWVHEHVLLMTNGESIIYEYRHGDNVYFPPHLFLGHCSDGRWLYSSFHFCISMGMVRFDDPPGSTAEFAKRYSAREFDGKSDVCLKMTE